MSSSEQDRVRELAERVARRLSGAGDDGTPEREGGGDEGGELAALRESLSEIQRRLANIESHLGRDDARGREERGTRGEPSAHSGQHASPQPPASRPAWLSGTYVPAVSHPSQEQFAGVGEAVSELVDFFEGEKTCNVEPGGKPCDHCGMCSSRGF